MFESPHIFPRSIEGCFRSFPVQGAESHIISRNRYDEWPSKNRHWLRYFYIYTLRYLATCTDDGSPLSRASYDEVPFLGALHFCNYIFMSLPLWKDQQSSSRRLLLRKLQTTNFTSINHWNYIFDKFWPWSFRILLGICQTRPSTKLVWLNLNWLLGWRKTWTSRKKRRFYFYLFIWFLSFVNAKRLHTVSNKTKTDTMSMLQKTFCKSVHSMRKKETVLGREWWVNLCEMYVIKRIYNCYFYNIVY
jgi:hypothetical protein